MDGPLSSMSLAPDWSEDRWVGLGGFLWVGRGGHLGIFGGFFGVLDDPKLISQTILMDSWILLWDFLAIGQSLFAFTNHHERKTQEHTEAVASEPEGLGVLSCKESPPSSPFCNRS